MRKQFAVLLAFFLAACQSYYGRPVLYADSPEGRAWTNAVRSNKPSAYRAYLRAYPCGVYSAEAAARLRQRVDPNACAPRKVVPKVVTQKAPRRGSTFGTTRSTPY